PPRLAVVACDGMARHALAGQRVERIAIGRRDRRQLRAPGPAEAYEQGAAHRGRKLRLRPTENYRCGGTGESRRLGQLGALEALAHVEFEQCALPVGERLRGAPNEV